MNTAVSHIQALMKQGELIEAERHAAELIEKSPDRFEGYVLSAQIAQRLSKYDDMLSFARGAVSREPSAPVCKLLEIEALLLTGQSLEATRKLKIIEDSAGKDIKLLLHAAEYYTRCEEHTGAARCYEAAAKLDPSDLRLRYNIASTKIALGELKAAEQLLDEIIEESPRDFDAWHNRSTLRKQTIDNNHISSLLAAFQRAGNNRDGLVQLGHALAKEYEDLGDWAQSFRYLKTGADQRRAGLSYNVGDDEEVMATIRDAFCEDVFAGDPVADKAEETGAQVRPIFILGLPRSGTTLVDRILSSHSDVASLGEINDFALSMMQVAPKGADRLDLVRNTASLDFGALGEKYRGSISNRNNDAVCLIDKTPSNFLYIGLIAKALPDARIIHMRRHPMDGCYAIYKTLFRMGYPYAYSQEDLGRYYIGYHRLMDHWRRVLPGRILDVDYEELVANQETVSRSIVAHCGLDWQDACLNFHENKSPTATASAAQVRQPVYQTSVAKWRRFEKELAPLRAKLTEAGIMTSKD